MSVEAVATRADEKILPVGVEIFFRLLVLPLWVCFCEQSGGMTKTALPIRFKPAWVGVFIRQSSNNIFTSFLAAHICTTFLREEDFIIFG
jgi:hypothetical protein